jgi:death-on-curing protein
MKEPTWLSIELVLAIHEEQIAQFGGAEGIRDQGALESALARAKNRWLYEEAPIVSIGAAYAFGIARNHAFVDGNKRTAFVSMATFLGLNDIGLQASEEEAVVIILALAAGEIEEEELARWIADRI